MPLTHSPEGRRPHGLTVRWAEDLLKTVLTRVASHWAKLAKGGNPEAYARKALVNQTLSWRRRKQIELSGAVLPEVAEPGQSHDEATVRRLALRHALAQLTPKQRAVIVLRFYEDRSEHETAQLMGVSIGTVKSQRTSSTRSRRRSRPGRPGR
jgi:RNA polymerase sigma factor (sigma-70 family)